MAVNIHKLIAAINPDVYCKQDYAEDSNGRRRPRNEVVAEIVRNAIAEGKSDPYLIAAEKAEPKEMEPVDLMLRSYKNVTDFEHILKRPIEQHKLTYDSFGESLEPIYFWIIDTLPNLGFTKVEKIIDNFASSTGSGHFSEMGTKATRMQEEAMKILGNVNTVIKSILNIIYDLKEFKIRLKIYDELKSENPNVKSAAMMSLKQIWMDSVDAKRGTTSIKGLAQQFDYVTIIDAFMSANSLDDLSKIDLNDRVKRILQQRVSDFLKWVRESERELRKRFEIEKIYLKSQYNAVRLYARWIKPYLKAAKQLEQRATENAGLVSMFNTTLFELVVLAYGGDGEHAFDDDVFKNELPKNFRGANTKKHAESLIVEFKFRSAPEKFGQNYGFRGKTDLVISSYSLNKQEREILKNQLEKDDLGDLLSLIEGSTSESLEQIQGDLDEFLSDEDEEAEEAKKKESRDVNPFGALFSFSGSKAEKSKQKQNKKKLNLYIEPDDYKDKIMRSIKIRIAQQRGVKFYQIFKRTKKMPAFSAEDDVFQ